MASKRRNMFYENKKQETTEIGSWVTMGDIDERRVIHGRPRGLADGQSGHVFLEMFLSGRVCSSGYVTCPVSGYIRTRSVVHVHITWLHDWVDHFASTPTARCWKPLAHTPGILDLHSYDCSLKMT
ncbi:hypothetical protein AAG570_005636 [Ranatra chinensis]|uniref:Uncharacterized protein n=1 Tax=Ranatra chinensis TaxID=642074 RepID=A0ABD0XY05_9HEMI